MHTKEESALLNFLETMLVTQKTEGRFMSMERTRCPQKMRQPDETRLEVCYKLLQEFFFEGIQ